MLEQVWRRYHRLLRRVAGRILLDRDAVEDVLQESFARALAARRRFSGRREALNYLNRVVINTSIDFYRKRRRHLLRFHPVDPAGPPLEELVGRAGSDRRSPTPLERLLSRERLQAQESVLRHVHDALTDLPRGQRDAIDLLLNRNGRSCREVCAEAGIPYSTARSRMLGGIDRIRRQLLDREDFRQLMRMRR